MLFKKSNSSDVFQIYLFVFVCLFLKQILQLFTSFVFLQVFHHGQPTLGDSHRFSVTSDPEDTFSQERLAGVYRELGNDDLDPVPFFTLIEHPIILDCLSMCHRYKAAVSY